MFCDSCENTKFVEKTQLLMGSDLITNWILYECCECKLLKIIKKEMKRTELSTDENT